MANGLRKLIRNARKLSNPSPLTRRFNKFGPRLSVEELEERIAPAAVALTTGELVAWDTAAGGTGETIDAGDGFLGIGDNTTAGITVQIEDVTFAVGNDTATLNLTITGDTAGAAAKTIHIVTNQVLGSVNLSGLDAATTGITLLIQSGYDPAAAVGGAVTIDVDGTAATATQTAGNAAEANGPGAVGVTDFAAVANAGMGAITMPAVSGTNVPVAVHLITDGTGAIGAITSADADLDLTDDAADSLIDAGSIGAISWAGDILPDTNGITITADDNAGTGIASLSFGSVSVAGAGSLAISGEGIGATTIGTGGIAISSSGSVTIDPDIAGSDDALAGFTSTGLISNTDVSTGAITIGDAAVTTGAVSLAGITVASTNDGGDVTFQGTSIGGISSSAAIQTAAGAAGDIAFTAVGATGTMGAINVTAGGIVAGQAGATITFSSTDGMGAITVTGNIGGTGAISFQADAGGTANAGDIPSIIVNGSVGNGTGTVAFAGNQLTGTTQVTGDMASAGAVSFNFADGIGNVVIDGDAAQGANVTFNANTDGADDAGSLGTISARSLGDGVADTASVVIDTNGGAGENTVAERGVGAITVTDGNAKLSITAAGDVGLITVSGGSGVTGGNIVDIDLLNLDAAGDGTNVPNFAGIDIADTSFDDTLTLGGDWTIPGTMGPIVVGGSDATDVMALGANNINVYAGDDVADGFDAAYASAGDSNVNITAGNMTGTGVITANTRAASNLFTYVKEGETFAITTASDVTANIAFEPDADNDGSTNDERVTITELAGTSGTDDIQVTTTGASQFDVAGITPATDGLDVRNITIEGDLLGNLGAPGLGFGDVETIIIQGSDGGFRFYGDTLQGYASTTGTLVLTGVDVRALDTANDGTEDLVLIAGSIFRFADAVGAAMGVDTFNHSIAVATGAAGATATIRGIDGDGTLDEFALSGTGDSGEAIDPAGLFAAGTYAMIHRIILDEVGGLGTDVSVREVDGTTNGSWLEFGTNVGLVNLSTQLDSISVGIDDNADLFDNAVVTSIGAQGNTRANFDRLGGGEAGSAKQGLAPATSVSDADAILGNFIVQSMGITENAVDTDGDGDIDGVDGDSNINIVVTGNSGPITLTGDQNLTTPNDGGFLTNSTNTSAAIAIGGNLAGAITIPGQLARNGGADGADIMIGIAVDGNNDTDWLDTDETPSGSVNAAITIGDAENTDILVADDITANIVVSGFDNSPEAPGIDADGDLRGVKAGGTFGDLAEDVVMVQGELNYVIADGALNSGIFSGGNGDEEVEIEGAGINGPGVLGGAEGISHVDFYDYLDPFGTVGREVDGDHVQVEDGGMTLQWAAGAFTHTTANDTLGDVYIQDNNDYFEVYSLTGTSLNVGDIFLLDDGSVDVTSDANVGVVVAADDVTIPTSETLQNLISTTEDVVYSPTALDDASGDNTGMLSYTGTIEAINAGGVVAEDDVDVTADIAGTMGYIVSLNGSVEGDVHAGVAIGSIVASTNIIDSEFRSEGTLAVGDAATLVADMTAFGLTGVPAWFGGTGGGVLSEAGDIVNSIFVASGPMTYHPGTGLGYVTGMSMGTFYVMAGDIDSDTEIRSGGSMGGFQVPAGYAEMLVIVGGSIDRVIVANWAPDDDSSWGSIGLEVDNPAGSVFVVEGSDFTSAALSVIVTGANTLVIVTGDDLQVLRLEDGTSVDITGNVDDLTINGDWAGEIDSTGSIDTIIVTGAVTSTAELSCLNIPDFIAADLSAVMDSYTIDRTDPVLTLDSQTLVLDGAGVTAYVTTVFDKPTSIQLRGSGVASLYSLAGDVTLAEARSVGIDVMLNRADLSGGAPVGDVWIGGGNRIMLRNVVVEGDSDYIYAGGNMLMNLHNEGNAGTVQANMLMKAFIGGSVDWLSARMMMNTQVDGSADVVGAWLFSNVEIYGTVQELYGTAGFNGGIINGLPTGSANGLILNSYFDHVNYNNFDYDADEDSEDYLDDYINGVLIINSYIGMPDEGYED